jgi:hypothetical protein
MALDDFRTEQQRTTREEEAAKKIIRRCQMEYDELLTCAEDALTLCADAHRLCPWPCKSGSGAKIVNP